MVIYEPVPARVPLHLGVSRADSSCRLGTASPSWEPPPTAPQPVARHPGGGSPAPFLPSPPRRWACGWSPERGARPLPPSDYSGCGGAIIAPRGLLRAGRWLAASTAVLGAWVGSASAARHWIATFLGACGGGTGDTAVAAAATTNRRPAVTWSACLFMAPRTVVAVRCHWGKGAVTGGKGGHWGGGGNTCLCWLL